MKTIIIKAQKELDNFVEDLKEYTVLEIRTEELIRVTKAYDNSSVVAYGNSSVISYDNSSVISYDNSSVISYDNSRVRACDNSSVKAYANSSVVAYDNSSVMAYDNSSVKAYANSSIMAYANSSVIVCDNSNVVAYKNSIIEAYDNSSVIAYNDSNIIAYENSNVEICDNSSVRIFSDNVTLKKALHNSIIILENVKIKIPKHGKTVTVIKRKEFQHDIKSFIETKELKVVKGCVELFKAVNKDTLCDFKTGKIKYQGIVECPDFIKDKNKECGNGLHLCANLDDLSKYADLKNSVILKCKVALKDISIYEKNISKVRCKKVQVLGKVNI